MKNKIFGLLAVLLIVAMLSVPIIARSEKSAQSKKLDSVDSDLSSVAVDPVNKVKGNWKTDVASPVDFDVSSEGRMFKEVKSVKNVKSEKLRHNIKMSGLFATDAEAATDGQTGIKFQKSGNKMQASLPASWSAKDQAHIKLKDLSGEEIADIIAEFDLTDSEQNRLEKGSASLRSIKSLRLVSKENTVSVTDVKGNKHKLKAHVNVGLNTINEDSSLDITTNNDLASDVDSQFQGLAKKHNLKLNNRGGVMKVDKVNLKNGEEVQDAKVTFKVEPEWVGEDNINDVEILRYDEGYSEVLPTEFAGVDEEGMLVFEGQSSNGLSTFAIFMTENITSTDDTKFDWGALKAFLLPLMIIVTVGAAFVGSVIRKEH
jgi:hypothetical protein